MSLRFYLDVHIPKPIAVGLRLRAVDILTAQDDDRTQEDDESLLDRAMELQRVVFSFDADMLRIAARRQTDGVRFSGLVFAHPTQVSIGDCVRDLEIIAKAGEPTDMLNEVVYLPL